MGTRQTQWGGCGINQWGGSVTSWSLLPPDPLVTNRYSPLSSSSPGRLMKMHRIGKLLCHTDNPDAWRSDRSPLWNHFPLCGGVIAQRRLWYRVWPGADGRGLCLEVARSNWTPLLNLDPVTRWTALRSLGFLIWALQTRGWLPLRRPVSQQQHSFLLSELQVKQKETLVGFCVSQPLSEKWLTLCFWRLKSSGLLLSPL